MIVIGTRGSDLALTQAKHVAAALARHGHAATLEIIRTQGDRVQHLSLNKLEGKGFFTKELEEALTLRKVDLAVHSLKDLPCDDPPGLVVAAISAREDARDCLIVQTQAFDPQAPALPLRQGARVGTSSLRRRALLQEMRPDLKCEDIRGNVPTRVQRLREGGFDALVLAQAGLSRLALNVLPMHAVVLPPEAFVPAPGQGALALQTRHDDAATQAAVHTLHDAEVAGCVHAERAILQAVEGGCHAPLGAYARWQDNTMHLDVFWHDPASQAPPVRAHARAASAEAVVASILKTLGRGGA